MHFSLIPEKYSYSIVYHMYYFLRRKYYCLLLWYIKKNISTIRRQFYRLLIRYIRKYILTLLFVTFIYIIAFFFVIFRKYTYSTISRLLQPRKYYLLSQQR
jgi:hypothetical protein